MATTYCTSLLISARSSHFRHPLVIQSIKISLLRWSHSNILRMATTYLSLGNDCILRKCFGTIHGHYMWHWDALFTLKAQQSVTPVFFFISVCHTVHVGSYKQEHIKGRSTNLQYTVVISKNKVILAYPHLHSCMHSRYMFTDITPLLQPLN